MKTLLLTTLLISAFQNDFDLKKIKFGGLKFFVKRAEVVSKFGEPKISYPKYECEFHSDDEQDGGPYYQLIYPEFNYIGSDKDGFQLEMIKFDENGEIFMIYDGARIDGTTTVKGLSKILGPYGIEYFKKFPQSTTIGTQSTTSDDGGKFKLDNERVKVFEYYSPC